MNISDHIGLQRGVVRVEEHDPAWTILGQEVCRVVQSACSHLLIDVQHVGSTSVTDMPAKPILDLAACVADPNDIPEVVRELVSTGFTYRGDGGDAGGHLLVLESDPDVRTVHLHLVLREDDQWDNYLRFRDLLRKNAAMRSEYTALKMELMQRYPRDRESYTESKDDFIRMVLEQAWERGE